MFIYGDEKGGVIMDLSSLLKSTNLNNKNIKNSTIMKSIASLPKANKDSGVSSFLEGEIVKGEVTDIKGLLAKILTANGEEIKGHLQNIGQLSIGDEREFLVKNENGITKFAILPEDEKNLLENNLKKQLTSQGIKATDEDVETAKTLIKNELPVNKEMFKNISRALNLFSKDGKSLDKALFMLKNEIPINSKNTNMLDKLVNKDVNMLKNSNDIENAINLVKDTTLKTALVKIFSSVSEKKGAKYDVNNTNVNNSKINNTNINNNKINDTNINNNKINNTNIINDRATKTTQTNTITSTINNTTNTNQNISNILTDLDNLIGNKNEFEINVESKSVVEDVLKDLPKNSLKFSIKTGDRTEIDDFLNDTSEKLDKAIKLLESNPKELDSSAQKLLETITTHKEAVDFMQFAKENIYLQLPLKINDSETNGELLVFKDKKRKKDAKDGVSAIIGLDTENLGRYETYIHKMGNSINLQFRLENEDIIKLTKENLYKLDILLKQYNLNIESVTYKNIENSFTLVTKESEINDMIDIDDSFISYNFNVKL